MIRPEYLKQGDAIAIISTARKITLVELKPAIEVFKSWGLEVILSPNLFKENHQFSATDKERLDDLQWALDTKNIRAIVCARGGYGTTRFLDEVDFTNFKINSKWLCGFSDVTALLGSINVLGIECLHSTMPIFFNGKVSAESIETMRKALFGEDITYTAPTHQLNVQGEAKGELVGGNLSILNNIIGTSSDFDWSGKILFIEDLDEYLYHIDRMLVHLGRAGKLKNLAGVIVGSMSSMHDNKIPFGKTAEEIIHEHCSKYNYPLCFGFHVGHEMENYAMICGRKAKLSITKDTTELSYINE